MSPSDASLNLQVDPPGSPVAFADRRPLPPGSFPNASAVLQAEGATYFW